MTGQPACRGGAMRIIIHYVLAVVILSVYGGQV